MENKHLFSIGNISKKHLILFIIQPIAYFMNKKITKKFQKEWAQFKLKYISTYFGFLLINSIILILFRSKLDISEYINNKSTKKIIYFNIQKKDDKKYRISHIKVFIYFIIIILLAYAVNYIKITFQTINTYETYLTKTFTFEIISLIFLSSFVLKLELYRHHYFSIFLIIFGTVIINLIIDDIKINYDNKNLLVFFGCIIYHFIYPLIDIIGYYIMYKVNMNLHLFLIIYSSITIISYLFISLFNYFLGLNIFDFTFFHTFKNLKTNIRDIFFFLFMSCCNGIAFSLVWSIFKLFKPWFYGVAIAIDSLYENINENHKQLLSFKSIFEIIIYFILIFACLIFNEQIICNLCELNRNCEVEIINRSNLEFKSLYKEELSDVDSYFKIKK